MTRPTVQSFEEFEETAVPDVYDVAPALRASVDLRVAAADERLKDVDAVAVPVLDRGNIPEVLGVDREALRRAGFSHGRLGPRVPPDGRARTRRRRRR